MKLRIGTRGSDLALWQARHVASLLRPEAECELVVLKTRGDLIDNVPLQSVAGKAFFTGEIEQALLESRVDLAVHSHKDLPTAMTPGLVIAAVPARASAAERLLVRPAAYDPDAAFLPLREHAQVGTSSPRRIAQLQLLRPDLQARVLRGNVPTRVLRLRDGRYDAIVLAAAGLDRLGLDLSGLRDVELSLEWFVPAPAQGALAIQIREGDAVLAALLERKLNDGDCARAVAAERRLLESAGGGCNLPLGAAVTGSGPYKAYVFLGAGHPTAQDPSRWASAQAYTADAAARRAFERLSASGMHSGPLVGCTVALTGSRSMASELEPRLAQLGASVVVEEVLAFEDLDAPELAQRVASLREGDALAVTSREAARRLAGVAPQRGVAIAAVGEGTASALRAVGLEPTLVGDQGALVLAQRLECSEGARVLFPCAEKTSGELERELGARDLLVEPLPLYRTVARRDAQIVHGVHVRILLSPSAVRIASELAAQQGSTVLIALGERTLLACAEVGWQARRTKDTRSASVIAEVARVCRELESPA
ncbi:MAG: hydroxymethylbilane synthase [Planctomycetota bacterium]